MFDRLCQDAVHLYLAAVSTMMAPFLPMGYISSLIFLFMMFDLNFKLLMNEWITFVMFKVCYDWGKGAENHNPATAKTYIYLHMPQVWNLNLFTFYLFVEWKIKICLLMLMLTGVWG